MRSPTNRSACLFLLAIFVASVPRVASAQGTNQSGTANLSGSVSKFVELFSDGTPVITGNFGGGSAVVSPSGLHPGGALVATINFGEVGPGNTNDFVKAMVPLRLRSNGNYALAINTTSFSATDTDILKADIGFGLTLSSPSRLGTGVITAGAIDTNNTPGDPTLAANGTSNPTSGRFEYTNANGDLNDFPVTGAGTQILSGNRVLNPVPRLGAGALNVNAVFSVKPQFYSGGSFTATVTFTATTP